MPAFDNTSLFLLLLIVVAAAWTDIRRHRIPNGITLGGIVLALCLRGWALGVSGLLDGLGGMGVGLLIFLPFYAFRCMGAGDVKLMMAVGAVLGPAGALLAAAMTLIAGSVMGLLVLLLRGGLGAACRRYASTLKCLATTGRFGYVPPAAGEAAMTRFPYAPAILVGALIALL